MRVVVLGGTGYLGSKLVGALSASKDVEVLAASRRGALAVDVTKPETYSRLEGADVVVDLTDATSTPPDGLIGWCLERGLTVIEATSDAPCVERLHAAFAGKGLPGRLVLGGGIFTGLSNLLGRALAERAKARALVLGIASSPFSGAGAGTVELMVQSLVVPPVRYVHGARVETRLEKGPVLDFGDARRPTVRASFAEAFMLARSTGAADVDVYFAPKPGFLAAAFTLMPAWLLQARWYRALLRGYFTVLRRWLLGSRATAVELSVEADGPLGRAVGRVTTADGMRAGAYALAAMAEAVAPQRDWAGVRFIDDVTTLQPILERANALAGEALVVFSSPAGPTT